MYIQTETVRTRHSFYRPRFISCRTYLKGKYTNETRSPISKPLLSPCVVQV